MMNLKSGSYWSFGWLVVALMIGVGMVPGVGHAYDHEIKDGDVTFAWKLDQDTLHVRMSAKTTGWVGAGFNPSKEMKDASFVMGYVKKGKPKVTDHFGISKRQHEKDSKVGGQSNVTLVGGKEENGITEIEFTIPLDSGDPKDQPILADGETVVLLANGAGRDSFKSKHQYKAVFKVVLNTGKFEKVK
jgi:hypothetical protein